MVKKYFLIFLVFVMLVSFVGCSSGLEKDKNADDSGMSSEYNFDDTKVGDVIKFGHYEQDNELTNGKEDIEWIVLDKNESSIFVISKYVIDCKEYNRKVQEDYDAMACTWEFSSLRSWVNQTFFNTAFTENERSSVLTVNVPAEDNEKYNSDAGNDTQDKVYILSPSEAEKYFKTDEERRAEPTSYAETQINVVNPATDGYYPWWLRTPGYDLNYATYVDTPGNIYMRGQSSSFSYPGVRPVMWIEIK